MSSKLQRKTVIDPSLPDVLYNLKQDILSCIYCVMPGKIVSFDASACTAQVQPMIKRVLADGTIQSRKVLIDCPVVFPAGGGARMTFPVAAGDQCLILFADRRIDEWMTSGTESAPADGRMHDMSDGIVIVGLDPTAEQGAVPTNKTVVKYQGSRIEIDNQGVKVIAVGGAEIDVASALVTLKNNTTTLMTLMQSLFSAIEAIQVTGNLALTPASITALEAVKTQMITLLG